MPNTLELPRMLRAVVELVSAHLAFINELVALALGHALGAGCQPAAGRLPGLAAVIGTLNDLSEPAAGLRGVDAVRFNGRAFQVIDLPAGEMRAADFPVP